MNCHNIEDKEILEKKDDFLEFKVFIPRSSDYFDGHFPDFHLLPAVAQIDIVVSAFSEFFSLPATVSKIKRMKFSKPILPDTMIVVSIRRKTERTVCFSIHDFNEKTKTYSSGSFEVWSE